ncbi:beta-xylosidase BxlB [Thermoclostridium stercorarium subsp. stercorarium DSM 8532]|jgi:beta-glucosidase|uniref:Beta-xylosidase BxlB n=2 Tax=Thermoclostridium stercorarium TaxID=1510 RepID=L7VH08_THES1|nr:glycoside hydrolase family 3 C-terminal domain-containing protein [Thermoclostridium stercorarium]AGC67275.1 beta-xylosidase BxlB [Thermoclostridium stercorarium subsp. stercorarium DSM 8532]AGI38341.1 BxlB [Thermoclostridium stercorarium subsp. stercorarium DSM 8532]ANW97778.1 glycosyl hydrolase [Thermoclostridium stercorarium subsp. thermolacticum DSM 2910]UZQ85851.1 glycoside hydrolase family 3 C-terminal domain-containing protein [Thermoclostridium stercorarium]
MENKPVYLDPSYSFEERAKDLVSRMTIEEKVSQMLYNSPAIERLGIPAYNWWNEALHGVARAGTATMFPQAIGMAATFDEELIYKVADVISTEGRAKYHASSKKGDRGIYKGLTFWSPNINIFRDPRWGRGQETYGEDPYLTARLGVAFVKGLQGNHPKYLKAAACAKHFAVHSGPESLRHEFNAVVSKKDLYETYLPAFKALVQEAKVESVMGAYNRTNGEPCCGSKTLLSDILRGEWGFKGHVVSDCWAIRDFHMHHHVTATAPESAALAVRNGCDLNCGNMFGNLLIALKEGLITEEEIDRAVTRLMITRMKLGMFDPEDQVPYASISYDFVDCKEHRELALDVAKKSIVLLKNDGLLPLDRKKIRSIAVIGPNADSRQALIGNYEGTASEYVTVLDGIREMAGDDVRIYYSVGCHLYKDRVENLGEPGDRIAEAVTCAEHADVVIMCLGLDSTIEGEEMHESNIYGSGDKPDLNLPGQQQELLEAVYATGKPIVLVLLTGSALAVTWADEHIPAILNAWYPGALGGRAIASVLFGETNPSGKLPVTFYRTTEELPDFTDYSMENRTYRFMKNEALYPFGFGLSYTTFDYSDLKLSKDTIRAGEGFNVSVKVTNTGKMAGEEVVQVYIKDLEASWRVPNWQLSGMKRVRLESGETAEITFEIRPEQLAVVTDEGKSVIEPGEFEIYVGGSQPDARSVRLMGKAPLKAVLRVQ